MKSSTVKKERRSTPKRSSMKKERRRTPKRSSVKKERRRTSLRSSRKYHRSSNISLSPIISSRFDRNKFSPLLSHNYDGRDPSGYFLSEKLDGYRALFYNDTDPQLFSRNNKDFIAPKWFMDNISKNIPKGTLLDGELFIKRGDFDGMGIVRKKVPVDAEWKKIKYMVFDLPLVNKPFSERYEILKNILKGIKNVELVEHLKIKDLNHFNELHKKWTKEGGEGSMLRDPNSYYENKRSHSLLKVKDYFDDEAVIEDIQFGNGKNRDVMGNLIVRWAPHSKNNYKGTFDVGSGFTDDQRKNWKKLFNPGKMITLKYFELQKSGKPRFPIFQNIYNMV